MQVRVRVPQIAKCLLLPKKNIERMIRIYELIDDNFTKLKELILYQSVTKLLIAILHIVARGKGNNSVT